MGREDLLIRGKLVAKVEELVTQEKFTEAVQLAEENKDQLGDRFEAVKDVILSAQINHKKNTFSAINKDIISRIETYLKSNKFSEALVYADNKTSELGDALPAVKEWILLTELHSLNSELGEKSRAIMGKAESLMREKRYEDVSELLEASKAELGEKFNVLHGLVESLKTLRDAESETRDDSQLHFYQAPEEKNENMKEEAQMLALRSTLAQQRMAKKRNKKSFFNRFLLFLIAIICQIKLDKSV